MGSFCFRLKSCLLMITNVFLILGSHDVRIRMKAVGICGSDVHYLRVYPLHLLLFPVSVFYTFIL